MNIKYFTLIIIFNIALSASLKVDKSILSYEHDRYINAKKGILSKKKGLIKKVSVKPYGNNLKLNINKTYHRMHLSRDDYILLNFECIEGPNQGFELAATTDINQGEYTVYGWEENDYVCIIAQNCNVVGCSDTVGPLCIYPIDDNQFCVEDINECDNQIMGDSNNDGSVNILDIINIVNFILLNEYDFNDCNIIVSDTNYDQQLNILDIVDIVNIILSDDILRFQGNKSS